MAPLTVFIISVSKYCRVEIKCGLEERPRKKEMIVGFRRGCLFARRPVLVWRGRGGIWVFLAFPAPHIPSSVCACA